MSQETVSIIAENDGTREQKTQRPADDRKTMAGVSGRQHGFVPLDGEYRPLYNVKLWNGAATAGQCAFITEKAGGAVIRRLRDEMRFLSESAEAEYHADKAADTGGAHLVSIYLLNVDSANFLDFMFDFINPRDIFYGLIKAGVMGVMVADYILTTLLLPFIYH